MLTTTLMLLGIVLVGMCLFERLVTRLPMSAATVYLAVGWVAGLMSHGPALVAPTDPRHAGTMAIVTEGAVLVSLFAVGLRLHAPLTIRGWRVAALLAGPGMLATIALATLAGLWLMPPLGLAGALLLAGILAPTDPVLASEVQIRSRNDGDAVRVSLTAEGGLNDGTALPVVMLALGLLGAGTLGAYGTRWMWHDLLWPIAGGVLIGWCLGRALGLVVHELMRRGHGLDWDELLYMGIVTLACGLSRLTDTSSFLVVFATGLGLFRLSQKTSERLHREGVEGVRLSDRLLAFGHRCERLVEVAMVLMVGFAMSWVRWRWELVAYGALLLLVIRPLSVFLTVPARMMPPTQRRLVAWFGIRGIGSLFYLAFVLAEGVDPSLAALLLDMTLPTIALSIVLHGISATPLMTWYRRRRVLQRRAKRLAARRTRGAIPAAVSSR